MADTDLYNNLSQTANGQDVRLNNLRVGFTFYTGAATGTLADVKVLLADSTPTDGGDIEVQLYTASGQKVADLALIDDQTLSTSTTPTDIPVNNVNLNPNAEYIIYFSGTNVGGAENSSAVLKTTASSNGTGVARSELFGTPETHDHPIAEVVENTVCFCAGTRIRTVRGDIAVEDLVIGDLVLTGSDAHRPIRWLGHRAVDCRNHLRPREVMPIRIAAHAFGPNRPARDLLVSPGHAICIDVVGEVLIPAIALVNGSTITQETVERVTYWHVELDSHDILLAENLPAESYLDMGNRGFFTENGVVSLATSPDTIDVAARTHADFCRPFHGSGPLVEAVCMRLRARDAGAGGWRLRYG